MYLYIKLLKCLYLCLMCVCMYLNFLYVLFTSTLAAGLCLHNSVCSSPGRPDTLRPRPPDALVYCTSGDIIQSVDMHLGRSLRSAVVVLLDLCCLWVELGIFSYSGCLRYFHYTYGTVPLPFTSVILQSSVSVVLRGNNFE